MYESASSTYIGIPVIKILCLVSILILANSASNFLLLFSWFQSNLIDSESSSLSALNMSEDEYLEDNIMDHSFASSHLSQSVQQGHSKSYSTTGMQIFIL